jgi:iron complex transport system substrate-binding protein
VIARLSCWSVLLMLSVLSIFSMLSISATAQKPQRIVSLSLCTDQLLLMLVEKERIAAISHLASDEMYSYMWQASEGVFQHNNLVEELIPLKPDLIIAAAFTSGNTLDMLERLGHKVLTYPVPQTLADAEQLTRFFGKAVQEPERAEAIIREMRSDISEAKRIVADLPKQLALSYGPNGYTAGNDTMKNEILKTVGYRNLAAEVGIDYFGNISLERLVLANPDVIIIDEAIPNQNSLAQQSVNHPALKQLLRGKHRPGLPTSYWICPGPISGKAIRKLAEQRR